MMNLMYDGMVVHDHTVIWAYDKPKSDPAGISVDAVYLTEKGKAKREKFQR